MRAAERYAERVALLVRVPFASRRRAGLRAEGRNRDQPLPSRHATAVGRPRPDVPTGCGPRDVPRRYRDPPAADRHGDRTGHTRKPRSPRPGSSYADGDEGDRPARPRPGEARGHARPAGLCVRARNSRRSPVRGGQVRVRPGPVGVVPRPLHRQTRACVRRSGPSSRG